MRRVLRLLGFVALVAVSVAAGYVARQNRAAPEVTALSRRGVETIKPQRKDIVATLGLDATIVANPHFTIVAPQSGVLHETNVAAGAPAATSDSIAWIEGHGIAPMVGATFVDWLVGDASVVSEGLPIAELALAGFAAEAVVPPEVAYRIFSHDVSARAAITDGPGPFDCAVMSLPSAQATSSAPADETGGGVPFLCAVPHSVRAVAGVQATVVVVSARASGVMTLPVESVSGSVDSGEVDVVDHSGNLTRRRVTLGLTDGVVVEITSGVDESDTVARQAPPLSARTASG